MVRNQRTRHHFGVHHPLMPPPLWQLFPCACCSGGTAPVSVPQFSRTPRLSAPPCLRYFATVSHPISEEIRFSSPASPRRRVLIVSTVPACSVDFSFCVETMRGGRRRSSAAMKLIAAASSLDHTRTQSHVRRPSVPQFPLLCVKP